AYLTGKEETIAYASWPTYDPNKLTEATKEVVVQVNGKVRTKFTAAADASDEEIYATALKDERLQKFIEGHEIRKHFIIKGKVINLVI
ncbi:MAG: leucine--tRNA ligase, partial [Erysipelotrichaceae bacterium]|nr:leucine--tRNA ligase [Erysipelotrichaceae bacterium]